MPIDPRIAALLALPDRHDLGGPARPTHATEEEETELRRLEREAPPSWYRAGGQVRKAVPR